MSWPPKLSSVLLSESRQISQIQDPAVGRQELLRAWRQDVIITQVNFLCREKMEPSMKHASPSRGGHICYGAPPACLSDDGWSPGCHPGLLSFFHLVPFPLRVYQALFYSSFAVFYQLSPKLAAKTK